jgi:8-oxo-dGTP diphosphatase
MSSPTRQNIVVGIIYNPSHEKLLLSRRPIDTHQGGLFEFPGGKSQSGETPLQTLERELKEEIDIKVLESRHLISYDYNYHDRQINLSAWIVEKWEGGPKPNEGQEIKWVALEVLKGLKFPQANMKLIKSVELPPLFLITPDLTVYDDIFFKKIAILIGNGVKFLQFRSPSTAPEYHRIIISKLLPICEEHGCRLIYNGTINDAVNFGAHGVHLNSTRLIELDRLDLPAEFWAGASCHNSAELLRAEQLEVDYCVISAVHKSPSHPVSKPLGWEDFSRLALKSCIPVYALGGVKPGELDIARTCGAHGIAMISGLWDAADPVSAIKIMMET